jgi:tetratricopeptide (TPR) repeat protein
VAEADRALENGGQEKASRLYERALGLRPGAPEAVTGLGYVMLDRGRPDLAATYFQRALARAPLPAAIFGLAETQRATGALDDARESYRRYLAVAPGGPDAAPARRQLATLEARRPASERPAPGEPPPSPSSVLSEPAAADPAPAPAAP